MKLVQIALLGLATVEALNIKEDTATAAAVVEATEAPALAQDDNADDSDSTSDDEWEDNNDDNNDDDNNDAAEADGDDAT